MTSRPCPCGLPEPFEACCGSILELDPARRWVRLEILDRSGGALLDREGVVEFRAHHRDGPRAGLLHERSRFVRDGGRWVYRDGSAGR